MTAPPPRAYRGRGAESGAKCGASDSGAVVAPRARRRRMDGFAPRERAYRLRDLGIEMYSWALRWGPCPCAPVFSSLSGISPRATTTHPLIRQYGAEKREREREKKKKTGLTANVPLSHTGHPIKSAPSRQPIMPSISHTLHLTPSPGSLGLLLPYPSARMRPDQGRREKRMHIHHARGTSSAHAYPYKHAHTHAHPIISASSCAGCERQSRMSRMSHPSECIRTP